jgi:uroporphyrinogen-III synthase
MKNQTKTETAAAPLAGRRVVITRPEGQGNDALRDALATAGAVVIELPLIEIEYTADDAALEDVWTRMGGFDWLIFTSANGVRGFFDRFFESFNDIRGLGLARIAAVGDATAAAIRAFRLNVDFQPTKHTAADLAEELLAAEDLSHLNTLVVVGSKGSETLAGTLETRGKAITSTLTVYATVENDVGQLDAADAFRRHGADAIIFASPSAADSFVAQAKLLALGKEAMRPLAVAIGPTTADALREHGIRVAAQAATPTPAALVAAVVEALASKEAAK